MTLLPTRYKEKNETFLPYNNGNGLTLGNQEKFTKREKNVVRKISQC